MLPHDNKWFTFLRYVSPLVQAGPENITKQQESLEAEYEEQQDIVQVGVTDGHRLHGYKILTGHAWGYSGRGYLTSG